MNKTNLKPNNNPIQQKSTQNQTYSMNIISNNSTLGSTLLLQSQNTPESTILPLHSCFNNNAITSTKENIIPAVNSMFTWTLTHQPFTSVDMFHLDTLLDSFQEEICSSGRNLKTLALCQDNAVVMSNLIGNFEKFFLTTLLRNCVWIVVEDTVRVALKDDMKVVLNDVMKKLFGKFEKIF